MIRAFATNATTGLFASIFTGAGAVLVRIGTNSLPSIANKVGQIGIAVLNYKISRNFQEHIGSDWGAVLAGMQAGGAAAAFPEEAVKVVVVCMIIIGTVGCILKKTNFN